MIGYVGGDSNTLVARRAKENDLRFAVDFPDANRMLTIVVFQTGEVCIAWSETAGGSESVKDFDYVGHVRNADDPDHMYYDPFEKTSWLSTGQPVTDFVHLAPPYDDDSDDD